VRSFAFERMLNNQGVSSVTLPPQGSDKLQSLVGTYAPRAVVGFQPDWDDIRRKLAPCPGCGGPPPPPPGAVDLNMATKSSFRSPATQPGGITDLYRLPRAEALTKDWNWGNQWVPRGDVGGVRTEDLEWVFVDKGDWPVVTFFTLGYEPPLAATGLR